MAHYAKIIDGVVDQVIVADADVVATLDGTWIQTSYNTLGGQHLLGGTPLRGNFAGKGMVYNSELDAFYQQQPYNSWTLNTTTFLWEPPVALPSDSDEVAYEWNEVAYEADNTTGWDEVN